MKMAVLSMILIFLIFELNTNLAEPTDAIRNIKKVLTLFQNYQRGFHYSSKNTFWNKNKRSKEFPTGVDDPIYGDRCYIHFQAKYGLNFTDLHSIFISQILALIYAWKFKERESRLRISLPKVQAFRESLIYDFFEEYGTKSESVTPVIMRIMKLKYPKTYEEFVPVSLAFDGFRTKIEALVRVESSNYKNINSDFTKELQEDAAILIKYIKNTLLQIPEDSMTGFGIDIKNDLNLQLDLDNLIQLSRRNPNNLSTNYDTGTADMVKSVVIDVLEQLMLNILSSITERTRTKAPEDVKSFILLQAWKEKPNTLIIVEIPYDLLRPHFPKPDAVHWSAHFSNWAHNILSMNV